MRKKLIIVFVLLQLCILFTACKTSYIENSKKADININDYFAELEPTTGINSSTFINDMYFSNEDESMVQEKSEIYDLYEGVNSLHIKTSFNIDYAVLGWDNNTTARFYLFNKGCLVPFTIGDAEEYNNFNDIDYTISEEIDVVIKFKSEDILDESGALTLMVYYNPEAEAGRGVQSYSGCITRTIGFTNQYYSGVEAENVPEYNGEYLEIPVTFVRNATVIGIGDGDLYDEEYAVKRYEGDVVVPDSTKDLYIYCNEGPGKHNPNTEMIGIMVDGTLCQISEDAYFIKIQQKNGKLTFKYPLNSLEELDSGLHSISIVRLHEDGEGVITKRFAVIIP